MKLHPRLFENVKPAESDIGEAVLKAVQAHSLTPLEVTRILMEEAHRWSTYALRDERHGDNPDGKKADEE